MFALEHRVRVFVFQFRGTEVQYLLLRQKPKEEWPLGPVIGAVALDECITDTVVREVRHETGIRRPHQIINLDEPSKELFGDVGLIEWPFAYQAGTPYEPVREVVPGPNVGEYRWLSFEDAFRWVDSDRDRDALVKLRLNLS